MVVDWSIMFAHKFFCNDVNMEQELPAAHAFTENAANYKHILANGTEEW